MIRNLPGSLTMSSIILFIIATITIIPFNSSAQGPPSIGITSVGNSGAAATSIQIDVPPGRKGLAPKLSLSYNSTGDNSWVGYGWSLGITEIQKSYTAGTAYHFISSGAPSDLIDRSANWGAGYYGAKQEGSFSKYEYIAGSDSWKVYLGNGMVYTLGSSARQSNSDGTYRWFLQRVEDTNGNYMTMSYSEDQGEYYLSRIDYTHHVSGLASSNYVIFNTEARDDVITRYTTGSAVTTARRLKSIETFASGSLVKRYDLGYQYSPNSGRSLLNSVQIVGSDGITSLPAMTFTYQTTEPHFELVYFSTQTEFPSKKGDFDGDGKTDYMSCSGQVWLSDGFRFNYAWTFPVPYNCNLDDRSQIGDFDGDGKDDVLRYRMTDPLSNYVRLYKSTGSSFAFVAESIVDANDVFAGMAAGDFNGDGKADIIGRYGAKYFSTGTQFSKEGTEDFIHVSQLYAGNFNFNEDGKDDILLRKAWNNNGNWQDENLEVHISKGTSFDLGTYVQNDSIPSVGDFNGDGIDDIIVEGGRRIKAYFSNITGLQPDQILGLSGNLGTHTDHVGDFNGDGIDDIMVVENLPSGVHKMSIFRTATQKADLLSSIDNGFGSVQTLKYVPSTQYQNTYLPQIVQTLSSAEITDGTGNSSITTYDYSGGLYDSGEREYRGFNYVKSTATNGTYTETWYHQSATHKGLPERQRTSDQYGNVYTEILNTYEIAYPYADTTFIRLSQIASLVYDGTADARQGRTDYLYDDYGNVRQKYFHGDLIVGGDERYEITEYYLPGQVGPWILTLPKKTSVKAANQTLLAEETFTYWQTTGNLLTLEAWLDTETANPTTTYQLYDVYGNPKEVTDSYNAVTKMDYDPLNHIFTTKITNAIGHVAEKTFDPGTGNVLTTLDANGHLSQQEFDPVGRVKKSINPNDTASLHGTISYEYLDYGIVGDQRIKTYETTKNGTADHQWKEVYFDGLGREFKTRVEGSAGKVIIAEKVYNDRGMVEKESLPYFEGLESPRWTSYEYDPIGRGVTTINPDNTYSTAEYLLGTLKTIDMNGHQRIEMKDIYGRIIKVQDFLGSEPDFELYGETTYEYDAVGNLVKITDADGNMIITEYDSLSRKIYMNDPDMGEWTYEYDLSGNLCRFPA